MDNKAQEQRAPTPEEFKQGSDIIDRFLTDDDEVKHAMALQLMGMRLMHYGYGKLRHYMANVNAKKVLDGKYDKLPEDIADASAAAGFMKMKEASMQPFPPESMLKGLEVSLGIIGHDLQLAAKVAKKVKEAEIKMGLQTFSRGLDTKLNGGFRPGTVLLLTGSSDSVYATMAMFYRHFIAIKAPATHFTTAEKEVKTPGVKYVPLRWWQHGCETLSKAEEVFKVADGYIMLVDSLDGLSRNPSDEKQGRRRSLRYLKKMSSRYHQGIIVGLPQENFDTNVEGIVTLHTAIRKLGEKPVLMLGDEMYEEESNGRYRLLGGDGSPSAGLEGKDGGTESPKELEGSGEDRSQGSGVDGGSGAAPA